MLQKKSRIETLQILRAIAFLEIFLGHCGIMFFTGAFGVSIFIVLSGFCISINHLPKIASNRLSLGSNVKNALLKIRKLYGLHLIMLVCAFLLAKMPTSADAIRRFVLDVLLVQSWSPHAEDYFSYNGVAWYLSVYLFLSIAAPYIVSILSKIKAKSQLLVSMTLMFAIMFLAGVYVTRRPVPIGNNFAFWLTYISPVYRMLEFYLGAALGKIYLECKSESADHVIKATIAEMIAAAAFVGVICIFHKIEGRYDGLCYTVLFTPVSMLLVMVFARSKGLIMELMNNRFLLWLGNLSSYTFLIHQVVIRWLVTLLNREALGNAYILILTILSFAITVIGAEIVLIIMKKCRRF